VIALGWIGIAAVMGEVWSGAGHLDCLR
jgi:hypothetical protein